MNERVDTAKNREANRIAAIAETMNIQFDEDQYLYCLTIYQAAAGMSMPTENPENRKIQIEGYGTVAFTDNAINRGMLAVNKELSDQGMDHRERMAMAARVMHFGDIIEAKDRFSRWFQFSTDEGALSVNEALMRAGATARIIVSDNHMGFDLDDVERLANAIAKRLDDEDSSTPS